MEQVPLRPNGELEKATGISQGDYPYQSWYSSAEIVEAHHVVRQAGLAVNDACGDFDDTDNAEACIRAVLQSQSNDASEMELAQVSRSESASSVKTARLSAAVLEMELHGEQGFSFERLLDAVSKEQQWTTNNMDDFGGETENSIGTIDDILEIDEGSEFSLRKKSSFCEEYVKTATFSIEENLISPKFKEIFVPAETPDVKPEAILPNDDLGKINLGLACFPKQSTDDYSICAEKKRKASSVAGSSDQIRLPKNSRIFHCKIQEETENRCLVADALISLARWEFRSSRLKLMVRR